jgi:hypothetical protein
MLGTLMETDKTYCGDKIIICHPFVEVICIFADLLPLSMHEPNRVSADCTCKVKNKDGKLLYFIVEMQKYGQEALKMRYLYYQCLLFVSHALIPIDYSGLSRVRLITFLDLDRSVIEVKDQYTSHIHLRDSNTMKMVIDGISLTLVDLLAAGEVITKDMLKNRREKLLEDQVAKVK